MEKPPLRENMDMFRAMRRLNSMPADMKHYVKSSVRKRSTGLMGSKEKGESGGSVGLLGVFFFCRNVFLEKINIMEHLFGHLQCKMLWREIQQIKWKSTKETNRPSSVTFLQVGLKPIDMIAVVKKTPLNMCRQQTCLKWMGENFIKHNFSDIIDASSWICFYRCDKLLSLQHTLDLL